MLSIDLRLEGDGAIPEMRGKRIIQPRSDLVICGLEGGMTSGNPSVSISFPLDQESWVFAETSLKLFLSAADALKARYGDPRQG